MDTPVSSINKTDRHDITEILFESGVKHHEQNPIECQKNKTKQKQKEAWPLNGVAL